VSSDERRESVAQHLRRLNHLFVGRDLSNADLDELENTVISWADRVDQLPDRPREFDSAAFREWHNKGRPRVEGAERRGFPDSVVMGEANPMGLAARPWQDGEFSYAEAVFDRAFEGAPQRAHGGILAALLDETMGRASSFAGALAYTGKLEIFYRAPTPLYTPVLAKAWCEGRERRKVHIRAEVTHGDTLIAEATAIFIEVDVSKFVLPE